MAGAAERGITTLAPEDFDSITGKGVAGTVDGERVFLGNLKLMDDAGI